MSAPSPKPDDNGPSFNDPLNHVPTGPQQPDQQPNPDLNGAPKRVDAAPSRGTPEPSVPPWKGKARREVFAGDIAVAELRSKLALAPDRIPEPPSPASTAPGFAAVRRLGGIVVVAMAGVIGFLWGSAPPGKLLPVFTSDRTDAVPALSVPEQSAVNLKALDFKPPAAASAVTGDVSAVGAAQRPAPQATDPRTVSPPAAPAVPAQAPPVSASIDSAEAPPRRLEAAEIALIMKNGAELLAQGDIAAARLMFERAAQAGDAMAAFALAETYDPLVLRKLGARGITANIALAQSWYEKARDLGSTAAPARIVRLTRSAE